jgi:hypothetical protein
LTTPTSATNGASPGRHAAQRIASNGQDEGTHRAAEARMARRSPPRVVRQHGVRCPPSSCLSVRPRVRIEPMDPSEHARPLLAAQSRDKTPSGPCAFRPTQDFCRRCAPVDCVTPSHPGRARRSASELQVMNPRLRQSRGSETATPLHAGPCGLPC